MTEELFTIPPTADPLAQARARLERADAEYQESLDIRDPLAYYISSMRYEEREDARESLAAIEKERINL